MPKISFIHTSDIHLGHQQFNLPERFQDFGRAFSQVVEVALNRKVDFILIGGDFFHKRAINAETLKQSMELLEPLKSAGIPVIAIEGNHDKAYYQDKTSWLNLLNSLGYLQLLKPRYAEGKLIISPWSVGEEGCLIKLKGINIIGLGYLGSTTEQRLSEAAEQLEPSTDFTVMLLHAGVNKLLNKDLGGVRKEVLEKITGKVDYLALGHIHTRDEIDGWVYNPGSLENCHIDEAREGREKGFYLVTVADKVKEVEYIPSKPRQVHLLNIDITGSKDAAEVNQKVWSEIKKLQLTADEKPMLQVTLKGEIDFSALAIDTATMAKDIRDKENCLYTEVINIANLPFADDNITTTENFNRADIENRVLYNLLNQRYPQYRDYTDDLVKLVLRVKEAALTGDSAEDLISDISTVAEKLPRLEILSGADEVAVSGGDDSEN